MSGFIEAIAPRRLGVSYRWLLASSWTTNIGDGLALAAGPLLIASQTRDPRLVALALLAQRLPFLVLGLYAGALADRVDRRLIVVLVNSIRALLLAGLSATILTGRVNVVVVLVALFALGIAETFADTTATTLLPMVVPKPDLGIANARIMAGYVTANQLAGPPIGAALFTVGMTVPFATQALLMAAGALLMSRIVIAKPAVPQQRTPVRLQVAEGIRWLLRHPPIRTLALTILAFNITFGMAWSVLVLVALERLQLGAAGYGMLMTAAAVGGLIATFGYGWLERSFRLATLMRVGLVIETLTHLVLATTTLAWVAMLVLVCFGAHAFVWGTIATTIRQRAVPTDFQGRVGSVYLLGSIGGLVIGSGLGGVIAGQWGITAPFWCGFVGSGIILVLIWRALEHIAHADG